MNQINVRLVNISTPSLMTICVDSLEEGEIQGRLYHYYDEEPVVFESVLDLLREMEQLCDDIVFPQASTVSRSFFEKEQESFLKIKRKEKEVAWEKLLSQEGKKGTFITCVKFRQRSTWQGDFLWKEKEEKIFFSTALEFVRLLTQALK